MEIQFLGTSSGAPTSHRNVSAIALTESRGKAWYLIDCGEGTQHQLLRSHLTLNSLEAVFLTHLHGDHCYGLPGLLGSAGLTGRTKPLKIIAPAGAEEWIALTKEISQLHLPYALEFKQTGTEELGVVGQYEVSAVKLSHRTHCFGYVFTEKDVPISLKTEKLQIAGISQGPLWGKLQAGENVMHAGKQYLASEYTEESKQPRKIIICGDNDNPELLLSDCADCSLLIHESTYTEDMADRAKEVGHSYAKSIGSFAEKVKVPNLVLTHISARYPDNSAVESEASEVYSGNLYVANDFDRFKLAANSILELVASSDV